MTDHPLPAHVTVTVAYAGALLDYLDKRGVDSAAFAAEAGLDTADLGRRIPAADYLRLLERAARLTGDPCIGLHVGECVDLRHLGAVGYAVMSSENGAEAVSRAQRYEALVASVNRTSLVTAGDESALLFVPIAESPGRTYMELDLTLWVNLWRRAVAQPIAFKRVEFSHPAPADTRPHARIFQCPVCFDARRNAVVFPTALVNMPMRQPDPVLRQLMDEYARRLLIQAATSEDPVARARAYISQKLTEAPPRIGAVAAALGLTPRTLQRKLTDSGLSYSGLVEGVREELARRYLQDPAIDITEVAFLLGYYDQSTFHRAFRRWTGDSPGAFRQHALAPRGAAHAGAVSGHVTAGPDR